MRSHLELGFANCGRVGTDTLEVSEYRVLEEECVALLEIKGHFHICIQFRKKANCIFGLGGLFWALGDNFLSPPSIVNC